VGRERGYPLGARGCPCDADYEDGSVPLQLSYPAPITASKREEKAVTSGRSNEDPATGVLSARFRTLSRPTKLSFGRAEPSSPAPSAHRYAAAGLDRSAPPNKEASVP